MVDSYGVPTRQSVRSQRLSARRGVWPVRVDFVLLVRVLAVPTALRRVPELSPQGGAGEETSFFCVAFFSWASTSITLGHREGKLFLPAFLFYLFVEPL